MNAGRRLVSSLAAVSIVLAFAFHPPAARAQATPTGDGLRGEYFDNADLTSSKITRVDRNVDFKWGVGSPDPTIGADTFSVRWTGQILPELSETYTFHLRSDDGARLWIGNQLVVDRWTQVGYYDASGSVTLLGGRKYDIRIEYTEATGAALVRLAWSSKSIKTQPVPQGRLFSTATSTALTDAEAARLLDQTTFGPTEALMTHVKAVGIEAFVDEQLATPVTAYPSFPYYPPSSPPECSYDGADPNGTASICNRDNYSLFLMQLYFFQNAMYGQDQLRQRVAFALGQFLVVSGIEVNMPSAMQPYQQLLRDRAFGNYRDVLYDVTLNPAMGVYLDMVNNDKPAGSVSPNENYARELLQLFSIGTYKLNQDGTLLLNAQGNPIPAYDQEVITGFARVFTGWTFPTQPGQTLLRHNPAYYVGPMELYATNHDLTAKKLLDGVVLPANQPGTTDLNAAIDNVFNHPNVGPFVSKHLIQNLVTSNPSADYVQRIANVFNNNGLGVRGDLKAVVRAIILDPEARGGAGASSAYGQLQDPALFMLGVLRALNGTSDGVHLRNQAPGLGQNLFYSPSVFNYYPPEYPLPGSSTLVGPQFGIHNAATAIARANFVNSVVYTTGVAPITTLPGATGTSVNLASLQALAADPAQLVDRLNVLMMRGAMSAQMRSSIITAVTAVSATDTLGRARAAVYLVATSSQYQVRR